MYRTTDTKEQIRHRLQIALGHLKKVLLMVEDNEYCIDIIHQSQAVQKALWEVDNLVMKNHLQGCVADSIAKGKKEEAIAEVMSVLQKRNG